MLFLLVQFGRHDQAGTLRCREKVSRFVTLVVWFPPPCFVPVVATKNGCSLLLLCVFVLLSLCSSLSLLFIFYVFTKKKVDDVEGQPEVQFGYTDTALIEASLFRHMDVVKRLLDCKQIDVNMQTRVSGMFDCVHIPSPNSFPFFFEIFF